VRTRRCDSGVDSLGPGVVINRAEGSHERLVDAFAMVHAYLTITGQSIVERA